MDARYASSHYADDICEHCCPSFHGPGVVTRSKRIWLCNFYNERSADVLHGFRTVLERYLSQKVFDSKLRAMFVFIQRCL